MREKIFTVAQFTWGLPQSLLGSVLYLINKHCKHYKYYGACVTVWRKDCSMSLGKFVFLTDSPFAYHPQMRTRFTFDEMSEQILVHEYGHTIQSLILGPLYLVVIGLPSLTWGSLPILQELRKRKNISYFDLYCEKTANILGEKVTKKPSVGRI